MVVEVWNRRRLNGEIISMDGEMMSLDGAVVVIVSSILEREKINLRLV
jgi:hypothetical protein